MKNIVHLLYCWAVFSTICLAQTTHKLSLAEALNIGKRQSEDLKIAQQQLQLAQMDNNKAAAAYFPNVALQLQQINQYSHPNLQTYFVNKTYFQQVLTPSIQAQWTIYNGGSNKLALQQNYINQQIAQNEMTIQEQTNVRNITQSYYIALAEQEKVAVLKKIYDLSSRQYESYQQRKQRGQSSYYELLLTEQSYRADELSLRLQSLSYEKAIANLCLQMGVSTDPSTYVLTEKLSVNAAQQYRFENPRQQNPLQKKWVLQTKWAAQNSLLAKSKQYPTISLNTGSSFLSNKTKFQESSAIKGSNFDMYFNAALYLPIYQGGAIRRNIQKANITEQIAKLKEQQAERILTAELKNNIEQYEELAKLLRLSEQSNDALKSALKLAEQRLQAGLSDLLEVRNLQINSLQTQLKYIDLLLELKLLEAEIDYLSQKK